MRKIANALAIIKGLGGDTNIGDVFVPCRRTWQRRGDQKPSLWISPEGRGLRCHVGCIYKDIVAAIRAKGIDVRYEGGPSRSTSLPPVNVDLDQAQRFLDLIDPKAKSWTFQSFGDDGKRPRLAQILHGSLGSTPPDLRT